ncbi:MAG: hypothetical protein ACI4Q3_05210 [Kiritimatiellia bacterium]
MKIVYQGRSRETNAAHVKAYLEEAGVDLSRALVEYRGEVYAPGADLESLRLEAGAELNVFNVVAGG